MSRKKIGAGLVAALIALFLAIGLGNLSLADDGPVTEEESSVTTSSTVEEGADADAGTSAEDEESSTPEESVAEEESASETPASEEQTPSPSPRSTPPAGASVAPETRAAPGTVGGDLADLKKLGTNLGVTPSAVLSWGAGTPWSTVALSFSSTVNVTSAMGSGATQLTAQRAIDLLGKLNITGLTNVPGGVTIIKNNNSYAQLNNLTVLGAGLGAGINITSSIPGLITVPGETYGAIVLSGGAGIAFGYRAGIDRMELSDDSFFSGGGHDQTINHLVVNGAEVRLFQMNLIIHQSLNMTHDSLKSGSGIGKLTIGFDVNSQGAVNGFNALQKCTSSTLIQTGGKLTGVGTGANRSAVDILTTTIINTAGPHYINAIGSATNTTNNFYVVIMNGANAYIGANYAGKGANNSGSPYGVFVSGLNTVVQVACNEGFMHVDNGGWLGQMRSGSTNVGLNAKTTAGVVSARKSGGGLVSNEPVQIGNSSDPSIPASLPQNNGSGGFLTEDFVKNKFAAQPGSNGAPDTQSNEGTMVNAGGGSTLVVGGHTPTAKIFHGATGNADNTVVYMREKAGMSANESYGPARKITGTNFQFYNFNTGTSFKGNLYFMNGVVEFALDYQNTNHGYVSGVGTGTTLKISSGRPLFQVGKNYGTILKSETAGYTGRANTLFISENYAHINTGESGDSKIGGNLVIFGNRNKGFVQYTKFMSGDPYPNTGGNKGEVIDLDYTVHINMGKLYLVTDEDTNKMGNIVVLLSPGNIYHGATYNTIASLPADTDPPLDIYSTGRLVVGSSDDSTGNSGHLIINKTQAIGSATINRRGGSIYYKPRAKGGVVQRNHGYITSSADDVVVNLNNPWKDTNGTPGTPANTDNPVSATGKFGIDVKEGRVRVEENKSGYIYVFNHFVSSQGVGSLFVRKSDENSTVTINSNDTGALTTNGKTIQIGEQTSGTGENKNKGTVKILANSNIHAANGTFPGVIAANPEIPHNSTAGQNKITRDWDKDLHKITTGGAGNEKSGIIVYNAVPAGKEAYNAAQATDGKVEMKAGSTATPVIFGSGIIDIQGGPTGAPASLTGLQVFDNPSTKVPTILGTTNEPGYPEIKLGASGTVAVLGEAMNPTRIIGAGANTSSPNSTLILGGGFNGSRHQTGSNTTGAQNDIYFEDFGARIVQAPLAGGAIEPHGKANDIPKAVEVLRLKDTAIDYSEQWETGGAWRKIQLIESAAKTMELSFRPVPTRTPDPAYFPTTGNSTAYTYIGEGIDEIETDKTNKLTFLGTESGKPAGMNLGGTGNGGHLLLNLPVNAEVTIGRDTMLPETLSTPPRADKPKAGYGLGNTLGETLTNRSVRFKNKAKTFISYEENLALLTNGSTPVETVKLYDNYDFSTNSNITDPKRFNSDANNGAERILTTGAITNLEIGEPKPYPTPGGSLGTPITPEPFKPYEFQLEKPLITNVTVYGLNGDTASTPIRSAEFYLSPNTTKTLTLVDGATTIVTGSGTLVPDQDALHLKAYGSSELEKIDFKDNSASAASTIGLGTRILDLKRPMDRTLGAEDNDGVVIENAGADLPVTDALKVIPVVTGWGYEQTTPAQMDKKLDLRDNALEGIGADFGTLSSNVSSTNSATLGGSLASRINTTVNKLDIRGNGSVLLNLSDPADNQHLRYLAYVRGNQDKLTHLNLSGCNQIVELDTFNRSGADDIANATDSFEMNEFGGANVNSNKAPNTELTVVYYDDVPQLSYGSSSVSTTIFGENPSPSTVMVTGGAAGASTATDGNRAAPSQTTDIPYLDLESNKIVEFSIQDGGGTAMKKIGSINLADNKIKHVSNLAGATIMHSGASTDAPTQTNIRFGNTQFELLDDGGVNTSPAIGDSFLDLTNQFEGSVTESLFSVRLNQLGARDIQMSYNPELNRVELTNFNRPGELQDFYKQSVTGGEFNGALMPESVNENQLRSMAPAYDAIYGPGGANALGEGRSKNDKIVYLSYAGSTQIHNPTAVDTSTFGATIEHGSPFNTVNNELKEVNFSGCTQLVGEIVQLYNNKIENLDVSNIGDIKGISLSSNRIVNVHKNNAGVSNVNFTGSDISERLNLNSNPLNLVNLDGTKAIYVETSYATTGTDAAHRGHAPVLGGISIKNAPNLTALDITGNAVYNLLLSGSVNLTELNGTRNVSNIGAGSGAIVEDKAMIVGTLELDRVEKLSQAVLDISGEPVLDFRGHHIDKAIITNVSTYGEINLKRQDASGEPSVIRNIPHIFKEIERGTLKNVNLTNTTIREVNLDENIIKNIHTANLGLTNVVLTGTVFKPNGVLRANFNGTVNVIVSGGHQPGLAGLREAYFYNNELKNLTMSRMLGLETLEVGRYIYDTTSMARTVTPRNLYNSFTDGNVDISHSPKLKYFAPATTLEIDKGIDQRIIRKNPVEPNEHQWWSTNAQSESLLVGYPAARTPVTWPESQFGSPSANSVFFTAPGTVGGGAWGYYSLVPIRSFNAIGCTGLEIVNIPGNRLTAANLLLGASATNLKYLDISGAESTSTGSVDDNYMPVPGRERGYGANTPHGITVDKNSNQVGGAFVTVWPNLEVLRIQNNKITSLDTSNSRKLVEVLAQNNRIGTVDVDKLTALQYLDLERNVLNDILIPIGSLRIFRAGQNKLTVLPRVDEVPTLEQIYLNHNNLRGEYPSVMHTPNLKVLDIAMNNFTRVHGLRKHNNLVELYAYYNKLETYEGMNTDNGGTIKIVDLSMNELSHIPTMPGSTQYMDISYNDFGNQLKIDGPIPAGMASSTPFMPRAHEVFTSHDTEYGTTFGFVGTLDFRENQVSGVSEDLHNAWMEFAAKNNGRPVYMMILKYNILDIDIYDIETQPTPIPFGKGQQKWKTIAPEADITILSYMTDWELRSNIEPWIRLYHPSKGFYELPVIVQTYHFWWDHDLYREAVNPITRLIHQTSYIRVGSRIDHTGWQMDGSRNAYVFVTIRIVDKRENPKSDMDPNLGSSGSESSSGESSGDNGKTTSGKKGRYNPPTGDRRFQVFVNESSDDEEN